MSAASAPDDEPSFTLFNELPKELRLLVWKHAVPGPRIIHLQRHILKLYYTTRIWSDKSIEDVDCHGCPRFFDISAAKSDTEDMFDDDIDDNDFGPNQHARGFRSDCLAPALLFVCRESYGVAERFYTKVFGEVRNFSSLITNLLIYIHLLLRAILHLL